MDRFYPNFYSLQSAAAEPLDPRFKRRSWNPNCYITDSSSPVNFLPYMLPYQHQPDLSSTTQTRRRQRCSSEAPASRRVSTFLPDAEESSVTNSNSPTPPIAVVKPTMGEAVSPSHILYRPRPCYGPVNDFPPPPPCMQMSTPEVVFHSNNRPSPSTGTLPRRRQIIPVGFSRRGSQFVEYTNGIVDYASKVPPVQDLTLRRRARRHPELMATEPLARRVTRLPQSRLTQPIVIENVENEAMMRSTMNDMNEEEEDTLLMSETLPPPAAYIERPRRNRRVRCIRGSRYFACRHMAC